jgi:outer membrane protein assembly factor BamB
LALAARAAEGLPAVTGYRGDRDGFYAGCNPPTVWDEATKKNLAWKTVLPNWCYGMPIVVGQKVFVMSEPGWKSDFPELACLDLETGKILWQKQIDHLALAVPEAARREKVRAAWSSLLERMRRSFCLVDESWAAGDGETKQAGIRKKAAELLGAKEAENLWFWKEGKTDGKFGNQSNGGGYGVLRGWGNADLPGPDPKHGISRKQLAAEAGLRFETYYGFGKDREGECFSTPASDGKFVYVVTEQGAHACFDLDGNLRWLNWRKPTFNPGGHDDSICRSPVVVDGLFITDLHVDRDTRARGASERANPVVALRADTGAVAWETRLPLDGGREQGCASSKIIDIDGQRYFVTSQGHIVRVKDGRNMFTCGGDLLNATEVAVDDAGDTIVISPGGDEGGKQLVALKLTVAGDRMEAAERWRAALRPSHVMALANGKLYTGTHIVDVATGEVTPFGQERRSLTRWLLAVAGGHLYGVDTNGVGKVFNLDGKLVATNKMLTTTEDPELMARHAAIWGNRQQWNGISYSSAFTFAGNRVLIRTWDHLVCFTATAAPKP